MSQSQTRAGAQPVVSRQRTVTVSGFESPSTRGRGYDGSHAAETVDYIALEPGAWTGALPASAGLTPNAVTHNWYNIAFGGSYASPVFLAGMQTEDGRDPAGIRYQSLGATSVSVIIEEEASKDREIGHTTEVLGYVVFDAPGSLVTQP